MTYRDVDPKLAGIYIIKNNLMVNATQVKVLSLDQD